jgi:hypothetical protein
MKTKLIAALVGALCISAHAGTVSISARAGTKYQEVTMAGIIPLEMATTVYSFEVYRATPSGMEVCYEEYQARGGKCDKWTPMVAAVPSGKTLVGWRIGHKRHSERVLDIYFK